MNAVRPGAPAEQGSLQGVFKSLARSLVYMFQPTQGPQLLDFLSAQHAVHKHPGAHFCVQASCVQASCGALPHARSTRLCHAMQHTIHLARCSRSAYALPRSTAAPAGAGHLGQLPQECAARLDGCSSRRRAALAEPFGGGDLGSSARCGSRGRRPQRRDGATVRAAAGTAAAADGWHAPCPGEGAPSS